MRKKCYIFFLIINVCMLFSGCQTTTGNIGQLQSYSTPRTEADWIRDGEPIQFEEKLWYPIDGVEVLLDSEVILIGTYKNVQFFVEKIDVRPFNRLYTKFGNNEFRVFKQKKNHD